MSTTTTAADDTQTTQTTQITPITQTTQTKTKKRPAPDTKEAPAKKRRSVNTKLNALQIFQAFDLKTATQDTITPFTIKKTIINYAFTKLKLDTATRKNLKSIRSKGATCEDETYSSLLTTYELVLKLNAMEFMLNAMLYYKLHHNFVFKTKRDFKIVNSTIKSPAVKRYNDVSTIYTYFVGNIEELNGYYTRWLRSSPLKAKSGDVELASDGRIVTRPTTTTKKNKPKKKKIYPYTLFIKSMWQQRPEELHKLGKTVMSTLAAEWREDTELQQRYKDMAVKLNQDIANVEEVVAT